MKKVIILTAVLSLGFASASKATPGDVYLSDVDGLTNGKILVESSSPATVKFTLNFRNNNVDRIKGLSNGFRFYGSDSSVTWVLSYAIDPSFPEPWFISFAPLWLHGYGADTIGFQISSMMWQGLPGGINLQTLNFWVQITDTASGGGTLCLDSSWFPPDGVWMWVGMSSSEPPTWDGPHCWPIYAASCIGKRGNVDGDMEDQLDITDLVYMIDYMFDGGNPPPCFEEADIDGSGGDTVDITDLVLLVGYMFTGGPPPADCP